MACVARRTCYFLHNCSARWCAGNKYTSGPKIQAKASLLGLFMALFAIFSASCNAPVVWMWQSPLSLAITLSFRVLGRMAGRTCSIAEPEVRQKVNGLRGKKNVLLPPQLFCSLVCWQHIHEWAEDASKGGAAGPVHAVVFDFFGEQLCSCCVGVAKSFVAGDHPLLRDNGWQDVLDWLTQLSEPFGKSGSA